MTNISMSGLLIECIWYLIPVSRLLEQRKTSRLRWFTIEWLFYSVELSYRVGFPCKNPSGKMFNPKIQGCKNQEPLSCPSQFYLILLPVVSIADQLFLGLVQPQQQDQSSKHMHVDSIWKTTMIATFKYQCRYRTCKHTKRCIYIYISISIYTHITSGSI